MNPLGAVSRPVVVGVFLGLVLAGPPVAAQVDVRVGVGSVKDGRSRSAAQGPGGDLLVIPKLEGAGLETAKGFRMRVTAARDDAGNSLLPESGEAPEWANNSNHPDLWIKLLGTRREASSVTVAGTLDVFVPSLDPNAVVRVENVFASAGKPIVSKGLAAAKVEVLVFPREEGAEGTVSLVGWAEGLERVREIRIVRADGTELPDPGRSSSSDGERTQVQLSLSEPIPPDAGLVFTLVTEKSTVALPFELKDVPLP